VPTVKEMKDEVQTLSKKALELAEAHDRPASERKVELDKIEPEIKRLTEEIHSEEELEKARKKYAPAGDIETDDPADPEGDPGGHAKPGKVKSVGEQFIESLQYKELLKRGFQGNWTSGNVDIKSINLKALTEGTSGSPGGGYAFVQTPTVLPGIVDIRLMALTVADLFPGGTTSSPLLRYLVETAIVNAAAATAEGALKPESSLTFDKVDEVLHKITTFLEVTDEMLEDYEQIRSYLDARLELFVKHQEEAQLLNGDGTGVNMVGLLNRAGLATSIVKGTSPSVSGDNDMDAIYRQITQIRTTAFLEPDNIVIDPLGWQNIVLTKSSQGVYYAGGPFLDSGNPMLWGKRVVPTPRMASLTALVGAFALGGQVFRKGGLTVEASNSHKDNFQRNETAIRAEERALLAVYRPGAFGTVTNL
jgi:HK97 family phage major capsid protein